MGLYRKIGACNSNRRIVMVLEVSSDTCQEMICVFGLVQYRLLYFNQYKTSKDIFCYE